jgi:hypothetical protein
MKVKKVSPGTDRHRSETVSLDHGEVSIVPAWRWLLEEW